MTTKDPTIEAVLQAVREWAMDTSYASWPAWRGEAERGLRFGLREIAGRLRAEDIQEYLDGTPAPSETPEPSFEALPLLRLE